MLVLFISYAGKPYIMQVTDTVPPGADLGGGLGGPDPPLNFLSIKSKNVAN